MEGEKKRKGGNVTVKKEIFLVQSGGERGAKRTSCPDTKGHAGVKNFPSGSVEEKKGRGG